MAAPETVCGQMAGQTAKTVGRRWGRAGTYGEEEDEADEEDACPTRAAARVVSRANAGEQE
jgi:hypothetical protein